jgi:hypothetical protein
MKFSLFCTFLCVLTFPNGVRSQTILEISPTLTPTNLEPIDTVYLDDNGTPVTQSVEPTGPIQTRSTPVRLTGIDLVGGRTLDIFNFEGARITLDELGTVNSGNGIAGVGVRQNNNSVLLSDGQSAFVAAAEAMLQDSDLNSYMFYDGGTTSALTQGTPDYRIQFRFAFEPTDTILVQERDGNTFFQLTALGINGQPIAGANVLQFADDTLNSNTQYDWNSGYANSSYQPGQTYNFTVASVSKFFEGTDVDPEDQLVTGFQINNQGNADVKFFGASDDTFLNNPYDPEIPGTTPLPGTPVIPEPRLLGLMALSALMLLQRRRLTRG